MTKLGPKPAVENPEAKPIVDATGPVTIEVTVADVRHSKKGHPDHCALAMACLRSGYVLATINLTSAYLENDDQIIRYKVGNAIGRELTSFDRSGIFAAGTYTLTPMEPSRRMGVSATKKKTGTRPNQAKHRRMVHHTSMVRRVGEATNGEG